MRWTILPVLFIALSAPAPAQQGDRPGEQQDDLPAGLAIPPAPVLSPAEGLASITVADGFRVELVAAEPLVEDPVAIAFDADGRLLVVEMRGFMPNVDGSGELAATGCVARLEDDDGDGRFDRRVELLTHRILPRAIAPAYGGFLLIEPPELNYYRDDDGDGRIDRMIHLLDGFAGLESPEHAGNGLIYGLDNWIHLSQHPLRLRFDGADVITQRTPGHGQWGLTRDDDGRFYYTTNSDPLRADLVPLHYGGRNPSLAALIGVNQRVLHDFSVWPRRMTPGVNRGYRDETLNDQFKLNTVTAACGPVIYRGAAFPPEYKGDAFVCEPAGFLVKRVRLREQDGDPVAEPPTPGAEFLTSTDERFRPVNAICGPDGALYIADMYRGILQHKVFMTSFLRKQVVDRGLDRPIGLGRIYRVVPDGFAAPAPPRLSGESDRELVDRLTHEDGWWRDTAQRLLVERGAVGQAPALRAVAAEATGRAPRLHALWTLHGLGVLTFDDVRIALASSDPMLRRHGLRMVEHFLATPAGHDAALAAIVSATEDDDPAVRVQAVLSLGASRSPAARAAQVGLITARANERPIRSALLSGLHRDEVDFLAALRREPAWREPGDGRDDLWKGLVGCALRARDYHELAKLMALATDAAPWQTRLILDAVAADLRLDSDYPRLLYLAEEPAGFERRAQGDDDLAAVFRQVLERLRWPGRDLADEFAYPWTDAERALRARGEVLYGSVCASCHQPDGRGLLGVAPPLEGTEWVLGPPARLTRILLHGLSGPIVVDERAYNADMPRAATPADDQIAAILTYIRDSWGNNAPPVSPADVAAARAQTGTRRLPWTAAELLQID